ncbi:hypothetical protein Droror1_Dr00011514 [Drosera rotundifolia]
MSILYPLLVLLFVLGLSFVFLKTGHLNLEYFLNVAQAILDAAIKLMKDTRLPISEHEVWNLLNELGVEDGIDEAYVFLVRNPKELRALLACPFEVRKRMLAVMMRA